MKKFVVVLAVPILGLMIFASVPSHGQRSKEKLFTEPAALFATYVGWRQWTAGSLLWGHSLHRLALVHRRLLLPSKRNLLF